MKFLLVTVMYLFCGCGSPPAPHSEAQMMGWARQTVGQTRLVMRRVSPNKVIGKVISEGSEGIAGGKIIPPSSKHMPVKELLSRTTR